MPTQKILIGIVAESWIGLLLTVIDVWGCIASDAYVLHRVALISICRYISYNVTHPGVFKSRNLTNIYMVTFKGHAVASLSCRESRYANQSTFRLGFDATLFFGFSFLPSSSSGCSNALVPLPRKSGLLICHAFVKMKQKNIYINLHRQRGRQHKIRESSVAVRGSLKVKH